MLAFPVTYGWGPVVSYNLLALLGPALSAWSAYCLCAHITRRFLPSLAGGYLYGFSSYEVGQVLGGHLGHSLVMLPPLVVLLFLRLLEKDLSHLRFTVLFTGCLFAQFLISNALFATMSAFGLLTLILAWWLSGPALRSRLRHTVPSLLVSYILTAIALSPYLYYVLAFGMPRKSIWPLDYYSADLVGFILPNKLCHFYFGRFRTRYAFPVRPLGKRGISQRAIIAAMWMVLARKPNEAERQAASYFSGYNLNSRSWTATARCRN